MSLITQTRKEDSQFRTWLVSHTPAWQEVVSYKGRLKDDPLDAFRAVDSPFPDPDGFRLIWFHSSQKEQRDAISSLAFSLDNLYGCIELINEGKPAPLIRIMRELERDIISQAMTQARANIRKAAVILGIKYTTLYAKIKKHDLHFSKAIRFNTDSSGLDI